MKTFSCRDQYLCMAFAQLTWRERLRDIETCLRAHQPKLYHMGFRSVVSRSTLADANTVRDWRIYTDFTQALIRIARPLYRDEPFGIELDHTVYALDATTIDLCLSVFPRAAFRATKAALKLHTLLDLRGYPDPHRRVRYYDEEKQRSFVFLINNFSLSAQTIAELYRCRWQVELFFKWIKQHLRIKVFSGRARMQSRRRCGSQRQCMCSLPS